MATVGGVDAPGAVKLGPASGRLTFFPSFSQPPPPDGEQRLATGRAFALPAAAAYFTPLDTRPQPG